MKSLMIAGALVVGLMFGNAGRARTQTEERLPVAGQAPAKEIAGAKELSDAKTDYKVVFSVAANAKDDEVHPTLKTIALDLNTLAHNGATSAFPTQSYSRSNYWLDVLFVAQ